MPSANGFAGLPEQEVWAGADWGADPDSEIGTAAEHADLLQEAVDGQTGE